MMGRRLCVVATVLGVAASTTSQAQRSIPVLPRSELSPPRTTVGIAALGTDVGTSAGDSTFDPSDVFQSGRDLGRRAPWAILASAVMPGAGQFILKQKRGFAYMALEAYAWIGYGSRASDARRTRRGYRSLSNSVARAPFASNGRSGDFDYYERMEHYLESGAFDRVAGGLLEPEEDSSSFNGSTWLLARRTYWTNPAVAPDRLSAEWRKAETFYLQRAIRPEYRWSWRNATGEHDQFRRLIRRSNDADRAALSNLGLALGNHVLSTIDAYVAIRLQHRADLGPQGYQVSFTVPMQLTR